MAADIGGAQAVLYVGVAGSGAARLWDGLHALDARLWLPEPTGSRTRAWRGEMGDGSGRADALLQHAPCALGVLRLRGDGARRARRSRRAEAIAPRWCGGAALDAATATPCSGATRSTTMGTRRATALRRLEVVGRRDRLGARVTARERFRGALLGLAAATRSARRSSSRPPAVRADRRHGRRRALPPDPGAWTDDTSMALSMSIFAIDLNTSAARCGVAPIVPAA